MQQTHTAESGELNRIVFEGIRPDDDPSSGMVVMKKFILYGPDGLTEHSKIHALDNDHTIRRSNSSHRKHDHKENCDEKEIKENDAGVGNGKVKSVIRTGALAGGTKVSAKVAISRALQQQVSAGSSIDMRVISASPAGKSKSVPDIRVEDADTDGEENGSGTPYSTINQNTINSILNHKNNSHYYPQRNNAAAANSLANEMTVTSMKSVNICEDNNSVYDTITSYTREMMPIQNMQRLRVNGGGGGGAKRRHSTASTMSRFSVISRETRLAMQRASRDILEKIKPIDSTGWQHRNWGGRGMEVVKAPIRFFLLLTTPTIDVDPHAPPAAKDEEGDECDTMEWNKPISCLHCITGPLFVVFATGLWFVLTSVSDPDPSLLQEDFSGPRSSLVRRPGRCYHCLLCSDLHVQVRDTALLLQDLLQLSGIYCRELNGLPRATQ